MAAAARLTSAASLCTGNSIVFTSELPVMPFYLSGILFLTPRFLPQWEISLYISSSILLEEANVPTTSVIVCHPAFGNGNFIEAGTVVLG